MYSVITGAVIALLIAWVLHRKNPRVLNVLFITTIGTGGGAIVACLLTPMLPLERIEHRYELASVKPVDSLPPTFVVGTTQLTYSCLIKRSDGSFQPLSVPGAETIIHERPEPHRGGNLIISYYARSTNHWMSNWALPSPEYQKALVYEFEVPKGTVRHQISVN